MAPARNIQSIQQTERLDVDDKDNNSPVNGVCIVPVLPVITAMSHCILTEHLNDTTSRGTWVKTVRNTLNYD